MTEHFIEYKGKKYTPLELAELVANELPQQQRGTLQGLISIIKLHETRLQKVDELIAKFERIDQSGDIVKSYREQKIILLQKAKDEASLMLLLSQEGYVNKKIQD